MIKIAMKFETDNDAFDVANDMEIKSVINRTVDRIKLNVEADYVESETGTIRDTNGNTIGTWSIKATN